MNKEATKQLDKIKLMRQSIKPDAAWVRNTRATILMQVKNTLPTKKDALGKRLEQIYGFLFPQEMFAWISRPVLAGLSLVLVIAGGSVMSVSAAEKSMPGDLLYGLKLASEQARIVLTGPKEDKLKLKTEYTSRRIDELKQVVGAQDDGKKEKVVQVAEILKRDVKTLKEQLNDVAKNSSPDAATAAAKMVDKQSNEVMAVLGEAKDSLPPEEKEKVTDAQSAAAETGAKAIEVLVEKHQESSGLIPTEELAQAMQDHAKAVTDATQLDQPLEFATGASGTPSMVSSTLNMLANSPTASSTIDQMPELLDKMKDETTQAFALQKTMDQLAAASSSQTGVTEADGGVADAGSATSADSGDTATAPSSSETGTPPESQ
ncbi:MAG: DUF5667 domain-containing protein [Patescibacteria group bacterium]|nr:DUF5667 domain-containing protein [Patescibacteria group bacterium]